MPPPLLEATDVGRTFPGPPPVHALDGVTQGVARGEVLGVLGPSGSGKSTLLHVLGLLDPPTRGRVAFDGADPWALDAAARSRLRLSSLGFVFQDPHLVPELSALANVALPARALGVAAPPARHNAMGLLDAFGLGALAHRRPRELSGGEAQRVALARALVNRPKALLMDEPTAHLDDDAAAAVLAHVGAFASAGGAVVLATHDPRALPACHRTVRLGGGRVVMP